MIITVRLYERKRSKSLDDSRLCPGPREALKKLLQNDTRGDYHLVSEQGVLQRLDFGLTGIDIAPQRQRPDTGIDENRHGRRERSAL